MTSFFPDPERVDGVVKQADLSNDHVILLVEDHEIVRHGVRGIITGLLAGAGEVEILEASTFAEANKFVLERRHDIELVVLDLTLPDASPAAMARHLENDWADLPVVVVSATDDWALAARFVKAGVLGFVPKSSNVNAIQNALRVVFTGGRYFPSQISLALAEERLATTSAPAEGGVENAPFPAHQVRLSPRQEEILYLILKGLSNKEISNSLDITLGTVKNHVAAILHAFNVNSRSKAAMAAIHSGFKKPRTSDELPPVESGK